MYPFYSETLWKQSRSLIESEEMAVARTNGHPPEQSGFAQFALGGVGCVWSGVGFSFSILVLPRQAARQLCSGFCPLLWVCILFFFLGGGYPFPAFLRLAL